MTEAVATEAPPIAPGWYPGMPMADYLAIPALSASALETFRRSPLHYRHEQENPKPSTPALEKGTALHLALLEPDVFAPRYVRGIEGDGRTKAVQEARRALAEAFPDAEVLSPSDYDDVIGMRDAVRAHPRAMSILAGEGELELTGIFEDPETGVLCKIRPDRMVRRAKLHANLKSTRDASPAAFARDAAARGYHRREAFYRRGFKALGEDVRESAIIAVENTAPYAVCPYLWQEEDLQHAGAEVGWLMTRFKWCQEMNDWPGYSDEFKVLILPPWAHKEIDNDQ